MNPFDDPDGTFLVLVNHEEQHSLWPSFVEVPGGWNVVNGPDTRDACMKYIEENWTDITPLSVRKAIAEARQARANSREAVGATTPAKAVASVPAPRPPTSSEPTEGGAVTGAAASAVTGAAAGEPAPSPTAATNSAEPAEGQPELSASPSASPPAA